MSATITHHDYEAFLAAIREQPGDTSLALVLADWLEERGYEARSALIRQHLVMGENWPGSRGGKDVFELFGLDSDARGLVEFGIFRHNYFNDKLNASIIAVEYADHYCKLAEERRAECAKRGAEVRRNREMEARAAAGDVDALLALSGGREAVRALVNGKTPRYGKTASAYCPKRKALAEAKARMEARERRRQDRLKARVAVSASTGRIKAKWIAKLRALAVAMGEKYHREVKQLYQSKYAWVHYGRGGEEVEDRERYSKKWHSNYGPARCRVAGARLDNEDKPTCVILENWRGTEVARLPLPKE